MPFADPAVPRERISLNAGGQRFYNGNPRSFQSFQASERKAFNGHAVVIVRSRAGQPSALVLRAESAGLRRQ